MEQIAGFVFKHTALLKGLGVVLSGGEPLLHWKNEPFVRLLRSLTSRQVQHVTPAAWLSLETSGYAGAIPRAGLPELRKFLALFDSVHLSPKVTPCLHGRQTDEELLANVPLFLEALDPSTLRLKFVARDKQDVEVIRALDDRFKFTEKGYTVYLMPYGMTTEEVLAGCLRLLPAIYEYGYTLTPRLHSVLWGKLRGV